VTAATKRTQRLHGVSIEPRNVYIAGAETGQKVERNMCNAARARRRRPAGVEEHITCKGDVPEAGRSRVWSIPGTAEPTTVHTESGSPTAPTRGRRPRRQNCPESDGRGAEPDLRRRRSWLLVRVPAQTRPARRTGRTGSRDHQHQGELDSRRRCPELFRRSESGMARSFSGTSHRRSTHHPPDPEMAQGGRA